MSKDKGLIEWLLDCFMFCRKEVKGDDDEGITQVFLDVALPGEFEVSYEMTS